jgi:hypothetical protein
LPKAGFLKSKGHFMPSLANASATKLVKALVLGESGAGKTGSLVSLVKAGYKLRVLDFDNKVADGILPIKIREICPDLIGNVEFEPLRDDFKATPAGHILNGIPQAYIKALGLLDKWSDGTKPGEWGPEYFMVLDSLKFCAEAIYNWAKAMSPSVKDPRQWFYTAQDGLGHLMSNLTSKAFNTNVLVLAHVGYQPRADGAVKGLPTSIGRAFNPEIPTFFDNMILCRTEGTNTRLVQTVATAMIDLKNPASAVMKATLPIETGLAEFVKTLRS